MVRSAAVPAAVAEASRLRFREWRINGRFPFDVTYELD
jgi:hypothetical protein